MSNKTNDIWEENLRELSEEEKLGAINKIINFLSGGWRNELTIQKEREKMNYEFDNDPRLDTRPDKN